MSCLSNWKPGNSMQILLWYMLQQKPVQPVSCTPALKGFLTSPGCWGGLQGSQHQLCSPHLAGTGLRQCGNTPVPTCVLWVFVWCIDAMEEPTQFFLKQQTEAGDVWTPLGHLLLSHIESSSSLTSAQLYSGGLSLMRGGEIPHQ